MQKITPFQYRWVVLLFLAGTVLSGCSRSSNNQPSSVAEQKAFAGDRSQMPESEKLRVQQMAQQNAGRAQNGQAQAQQGRQSGAPR